MTDVASDAAAPRLADSPPGHEAQLPFLSVFMDKRDREEFIWNHRVKEAWREMLRAAQWSHYIHLTFHEEPSEFGVRKCVEWWLTRLKELTAETLTVFWACEVGTVDGRLHVHALLAGTGMITCKKIGGLWGVGHSRVQCYRADLRGVRYVTKQLGGRALDYQIESL